MLFVFLEQFSSTDNLLVFLNSISINETEDLAYPHPVARNLSGFVFHFLLSSRSGKDGCKARFELCYQLTSNVCDTNILNFGEKWTLCVPCMYFTW